MSVFVDTSAFLAVLNTNDVNHLRASEILKKLISTEEILVCHNYILVETLALLQNRFGTKAVKIFSDDILPLIEIEWVDEIEHKSAVSALITAAKKDLSFVDCVSFEIMRQLGIDTAFSFDPHFTRHGFKCIP